MSVPKDDEIADLSGLENFQVWVAPEGIATPDSVRVVTVALLKQALIDSRHMLEQGRSNKYLPRTVVLSRFKKVVEKIAFAIELLEQKPGDPEETEVPT